MMSQPASACTSACLHQHGDGLVVEDDAVAHQAVVAVAGVGIERDVAEHADLRHRLLDGADRLADQVVRIERLAAVLVAQARVGVGKDRDAGDGELRRLLRRAHDVVDRQPLDAGHRGDRRTAPFADEQRPDQVVGREHAFAHHAPRPFAAAVAARPGGKVERGRGFARRFNRGEAHAAFDRTAVFDRHAATHLRHCRARPGNPS